MANNSVVMPWGEPGHDWAYKIRPMIRSLVAAWHIVLRWPPVFDVSENRGKFVCENYYVEVPNRHIKCTVPTIKRQRIVQARMKST